jgi:hypothetical protein
LRDGLLQFQLGANGQLSRLSGLSIPFAVLLVSCWALQFLGTVPALGFSDQLLYIMFVVPTSIFALVGVVMVLVSRKKVEQDVWILAVFLGIVGAVSISRSDFPTILTNGLMSAILVTIIHFKIRISPSQLNFLFLLSIPISYAFYASGFTGFPVFPSFSSISTISWRVSVLPLISSGGFFALVVLFVNVFYKTGRFRIVCLPVSLYFLIFSGMRTAIFAALLAGLYFFLRRSGFLSKPIAQFVFFGLAVGFFSLSIFSSDQLANLPILSNDFVRSLIVREESVYDPNLGGELYTAALRSWMIGRHIEFGLSNPLFGIGTFDFQLKQNGYGMFDNATTGSEAYLTGLFARIGLMMLPFIYVIYRARVLRSAEEQDFARCMKLILFLSMITYGSFVVPYDLIFLLMITGILNGYAGETFWTTPEKTPSLTRPSLA